MAKTKNVIVATECRFINDESGVPCSDKGNLGYPFWKRYLDAFDNVTILARLGEGQGAAMVPVEGPNVRLHPLPFFIGPSQYALKRHIIKKQIRKIAATPNTAFIVRVPGEISNLLTSELIKQKRPYAVEVIGDPHEVFAKGAVKHLMRPLIRLYYTQQLKTQCAKAIAVSYVNNFSLPSRYPAAPSAFTTNYSSIELKKDTFVEQPRSAPKNNTINLVIVGTLEQPYKAHDILIDAVTICQQKELDVRLSIVGKGYLRAQLESQVRKNNIEDAVTFRGQVSSGDGVRAELDKADIFVLPSRTEGLPRAMIEAMARGLPCIGSNVGGIPELLDPENMVPSNDAEALANKLQEVIADKEHMVAMSAQNLKRAEQYESGILQEKRKAFYSYIASNRDLQK